MGYYTDYSLTVRGVQNETEFNALRNEVKNFYGLYVNEDEAFDTEVYFPVCDEAKWYDHETDMRELSRKFPNMTFCLEGDGEDREDMWREYYHNGDMEYCPAQIVYEEPTKIKWDN